MAKYMIKEKDLRWSFVPFAGRNKFSTTLGDVIYLSPERYKDWKSGKPKDSTRALVAHEKVHVDQYHRNIHFKKSYLTSRYSRLKYEAEAYAMSVAVRVALDKNKKHDYTYYLNKYAKVLASNTYLLFMSYERVYRAIRDEYDKLRRTPNAVAEKL